MTQPWLDQPHVRRTLTRMIALPVILVTILAVVFLGQITYLLSTTQSVDHTDNVIAHADHLQKLLVDMETGLRGYLVTGSPVFLDPYRQAVASLDTAFADLGQLVTDNPSQVQRLDAIRAGSAQWDRYARTMIALRDGGGAYQELAINAQGKQQMDGLRERLAALLETEQTLRSSRTRAVQQVTAIVIGLGVGLTLVLGGALALFARRQLMAMVQNYGRALAVAHEQAAALRESQQLLRAIVESSDDAIISKTLDGVISSWNPGAERLFGFTALEAIGQPMLLVIPPEHAAEEPEILALIARGENVDHFETVRVRKDGSRIDISATISPIKDGHGQITGASKIARDITERKQAERKLQAHLERLNLLHQITRAIGERQDLRSIFQVVIRRLEDQLPIDFCCVCRYDSASNALTVTCVGLQSETLARELAMTEHACIPIDQNGLSRCVHGQLVYEPDISQVQFPFPQRLTRGGLRSLVVAPLLVENEVFGVLVTARHKAHSFSSGECEFLRQLSEHVALAAHQAQLYAALQQAYDDLRQTQQAVLQQERLRALGQMASGIAHDINNAISPVALYTESLLETEPNLSGRARNYLETIQRAIDDVAATVARMREFYRPREAQVMLTPVQLNPLVQQVVDLTRARWSDMPQQRGIVIQLVTEVAPNLPPIMGIESELREALTNLIFNAVDAMPEGGTLRLRIYVADDAPGFDAVPAPRYVQLEVADTGVGMDEDTRRRCLEPFFTTKGERGTGLGLAMLYGMVQRHSAELAIDSALGMGTTVRLSFAVPAAMVEPAQPALTYTVPARLRILVVDDDPLLLQSLRDTLEGEGHTVITANSGQGGIDGFRAAHAHGETFAVVITDLGMPYIDGRQVASAVKEASPGTPVILLTGWGQRLTAEGEIPPHVDRVIAKPPKLRDLRAALAHCCPPARA